MKHITILIICTAILSLLLIGSIVMSILSIMKKQTPGPQGPQGPKGATGPKGASGIRGAAGMPASSRDNDDEQNLEMFADNFTKLMSLMYSNAISTTEPSDGVLSDAKLNAAQDAFTAGMSNAFDQPNNPMQSHFSEALTNSGWQSGDNNAAFRKATKNIGLDCDEDSSCSVDKANQLKQDEQNYVGAESLNIGGSSKGFSVDGTFVASSEFMPFAPNLEVAGFIPYRVGTRWVWNDVNNQCVEADWNGANITACAAGMPGSAGGGDGMAMNIDAPNANLQQFIPYRYPDLYSKSGEWVWNDVNHMCFAKDMNNRVVGCPPGTRGSAKRSFPRK